MGNGVVCTRGGVGNGALHEGFALRKVCDGHKSQRGLCTRGGAFARGASRFAWAFASPFARGGGGGLPRGLTHFARGPSGFALCTRLCTRAITVCTRGRRPFARGGLPRGLPPFAQGGTKPICTRAFTLRAAVCTRGLPCGLSRFARGGGGMTRLPCGPSPFTLGPSGFARGFARGGGGSTMVFLPLHEALHEDGGGAPTCSLPLCTRLCTRGGSHVVSPFHMWLCTRGGGLPLGLSPFARGFARGGGAPTCSPPVCTRVGVTRGLTPPPFSSPPPLHFRGT